MSPQQLNKNIKDQFLAGEELPSGMPRRFLFFSFIIFLAALLTQVGISIGYKSFLNRSIERMDNRIEDLSFQITPEQQDSLKKLYSQIGNLQDILDGHVMPSGVFPVLERNTQSKVAYESMEMSIPDRQIVLNGVTASYDDLVAQLAIFEQEPQIEKLILESSERDGSIINFRVVLIVAPEVFKLINDAGF